ncbi:hypothetical protein [Prauserella flavalba]|uniref:Uncharacterized protein n=1 Tax=Prauserella flavalba TaxID=1477506 RepID=A0A318LWJ9_9PSEU|nr:hypothetical protein [Prauserella flavalba]PXY36678.1 hypothetical protein BA062_15050 [Prauserella flavalba]
MPEPTRRSGTTGEFAELLCADPDWVRAEFDAIVAANFDHVTPQPPARPGPARPPAGEDRCRPDAADLTGAFQAARLRPWRRQRSPPLRTTNHAHVPPEGR